MRLHGLYERVKGWRRKYSADGFEINASEGCSSRFVVPRVEDKTRKASQFLSLIDYISDCRPEHAVPRCKLKQRGPPRRQLRIVWRLRQRLAGEFGFQLLERLASCVDTRLKRRVRLWSRNHFP